MTVYEGHYQFGGAHRGGMAPRTRERAEIARDLWADGLTHSEIAIVLKCSRSRVTQMLAQLRREDD